MPAVPLIEPHGPFSQMLLFGDSLSDVGNVYRATWGFYPPSPPHYNGRFSNGPVWSEITAGRLGLPALEPSLAGGSGYAYGSAETGNGLSSFGMPNLGEQIATRLIEGPIGGDALVVVWGGANDFLQGGQDNPAVPVANLARHVSDLAQAGGSVFLVPNLPPLGQTPAHHGTPSEATLDQLSTEFNALLAAELGGLERRLGVTIVQMDVFALFGELLARPSAYGLTNVTDPAYDGDNVAPDVDEHLFWDEVHPTATAHDLLAGVSDPLVAGDTDGDGDVDAFDYVAVKQHCGAAVGAGRHHGDLDGDGDVDRSDFLILRCNFPRAPAPAAVPEPTAAILLALCALALPRRTRRMG
jgi:phospholipase/lecithinase/hemolysin